jgi:aspartyl protease family protein
MVRIKSIRVGKFTLENVECSVLGPEAVNALPLLGMSFLGNFKFEIDAAAGTLEMTTIEVEGSRSSRKRP